MDYATHQDHPLTSWSRVGIEQISRITWIKEEYHTEKGQINAHDRLQSVLPHWEAKKLVDQCAHTMSL